MIQYDSSRFYLYQELADLMRQVAETHPRLVKVYPIGQSTGGRELLVAEVTNMETGDAAEKPAVWIDGNTHATELAGSAAALYLLHCLAEQYGADESITHLLDTRTVYILPRLSPDGAEHCLTTGDWIRSTTKPYPFEERWEGLRPADINGDGLIVQMRIQDPLGEWKVSDKDARIMVRRGPDDRRGPFYHVYREGMVEDWDGFRMEVKPSPYSMDFNRNYPFEWAPENVQRGAGRFPLSEPVTRAVVEFITSHPNIGLVHTFHTYSAAILRPSSTRPDDDLPVQDVATYKALGRRGTELTGYPCISVYHDFRYRPKEFIRGGFDDWCYDHYGVYAFTTEIWSIGKAAGLEITDHIKFLQARTESDTAAILKWNDEQGVDGFVPWTPFDHPQLGAVEIGGWKTLWVWSNPPARFLAAECEKMARWVLATAVATPRIRIEKFDGENLGGGLRKVTLVVANEGWLPTCITQKAMDARLTRPIEVTLEVVDKAELLMGRKRTEMEHLSGTATVVADGPDDPVYFRGVTQSHRNRLEWLVRGDGPIQVTVRCERGGTCRATTY